MGASRFYAVLAALLFAAVCAYMAAAVFNALEPQPEQIVPVLAKSGGGELRGIILRNEEYAPQMLKASAGERVPTGASIPRTALFFPESDGYEHLSPAGLEDFTTERLDELFKAQPKEGKGARLIYGFDCYYAAYYYGNDIEPGPCRLKFEGERQSRRAELISCSRSGTDCALLFRLMLDNSLAQLRFCRAELIY